MKQNHDTFVWTGLAGASFLLAIDPLKWLINSWQDPSYQSQGGLYCLALVGIGIVSFRSSKPIGPQRTDRVFILFFVAAGVRFLGQSLAINILSALALAVDVYVLATFLGLDRRRFAVSPFWMAVFFLFALPLGPILQRVAGYPLQMVSAEMACGMLSPVFADLLCEGVRLRVNGADVLVDLPCSGASGLLLMISLWAFLNVIYRPALFRAVLGLGLVVTIALLGNALRISLLAAGLALGFDTMAYGPHVLIGLLTLFLSATTTFVLYQPSPVAARGCGSGWALPTFVRLPAVATAMIAAASIVTTPKTPIDVSTPVREVILPLQLNGQRAVHVPLSETEAHYFTAFGGTAQKVQYGPLGLNVVRTSSPLRHLHSPETCLRGMGFDVRFMGTRFDPIPTSIYEATGPDGRVWTVAVSFVSDDGHATAGVGEAVWSWLSGASHQWQSIQRITPANLPEITRISYEQATLAALDLSQ